MAEQRGGLSFNHAMIYVRDVARARAFYAGLLGFRVLEQYEHRGRPVYVRLRAPRGQSSIALHMLERGQKLAPGGIRLYFESADLDGLYRRLKAAGVKLKQAPRMMPWGWKHAYVDDPDGHEVSLYWAGKKRLKKSA